MSNVRPDVIAITVLEFIPAFAFALWADPISRAIQRLSGFVRILLPGLFGIPYAALAAWNQTFRWEWLAVYCCLPILVASLLAQATRVDPDQRGNWRDALILLTVGLAVDLRWFDVAWPAGLRGLGNLLLLDAGLYGFLGIRRLSGTGFDFHF